ncbi:MAG: UDP-N-acetylmuramate--L-alanine ligase [Phototrophicales bacterium]|nr:MAG: UDP-N-acetylmuramate--L-alanine ligase [Phototrophicales bacterium]RMG72430.1 MAG: UDP-N-acetylmuramate--L-alanine ligase [Chloroflexota bacterium]
MIQPGQHIHCIGIGGFGISAIARILLLRGYKITGSDRNSNALSQALAQQGVTIYQGHDPAHIHGADAVIATSAVPDDHVEILAAQAAGIPVYRRKQILPFLLQGYRVIAVAGTHGKTTTTAMIVHILQQTGKSPSYIVGGIMPTTGTNADVGSSDLFVIEADEYGDMFHGLSPDVIVLTSLEYDHPDYFPTEAAMYDSFQHFIKQVHPHGTIIPCMDYPAAFNIVTHAPKSANIIPYGQDERAAMRAVNIRMTNQQTLFDVHMMAGALRVNAGTVTLGVPGEHNVLNALGALIAADVVGVVFEQSAAALASFQSAGRRFERRGVVDDIIVIDDYAHHPTAVKATLQAARLRYPNKQIWAVWQPHMYSRTQRLIQDYATAFDAADHILVTDIYAAREAPIPGIDAAWTASHIPRARYTASLDQTTACLLAEVQPGSVIIIMSAGDAPKIGQDFLAKYGSIAT